MRRLHAYYGWWQTHWPPKPVRIRGFLRRHKQGEEAIAEGVAINVAWRTIMTVAASGAASAAITAVATQTSTPAYHPPYNLSIKGAAFLSRNEGLRLTPYNDPYNCTVGVGHLIHYGVCTTTDIARWTLTYQQAQAMLIRDVNGYAGCVRNQITHKISQPQFDALVDISFNAGCGVLDYSGLKTEINEGRLAAVPATMAVTAVTSSGRYLAGLHTRRLAEGTLFKTGYYGAGIGYYVKPKPLTAAEKAILALKTRTGYWSWLTWQLGEGAWKRYGPHNPHVRPHVPARIPAGWWTREKAFLKARHT
jgi:lysozyme